MVPNTATQHLRLRRASRSGIAPGLDARKWWGNRMGREARFWPTCPASRKITVVLSACCTLITPFLGVWDRSVVRRVLVATSRFRSIEPNASLDVAPR